MRVTLIALLLAAGCTCQSDGDCPLEERCSDGRCIAVGGGPDVTPPVVAFSSPLPGATVAGAVSLAANASDDIGVSSVDFTVDGAIVGSAQSEPYTVTWQSGGVWNGPHAFKAIA